MDSKIKTSFIPKKSVTQRPGNYSTAHRSGGIDILMLLAIVSVVVAGVLSVGVFLYKGIVIKESETKIARLEKSRDDFQPALIRDFQKLSNRIQVANDILKNHIAPSIFLYSLERDTLSGVQFTELTFKPTDNDTAEFALKGKTNSVNSIALQSAKFTESDIIKSSIFSDIDLVNGGVIFSVSGTIDLNVLRFSNVVNGTFVQPVGSVTNNDVINPDLSNDALDFGGFGNFNQ